MAAVKMPEVIPPTDALDTIATAITKLDRAVKLLDESQRTSPRPSVGAGGGGEGDAREEAELTVITPMKARKS